MIPVLYTLLGALIALEAGFIHNRHQDKLRIKKEDRILLIEADQNLARFGNQECKNKKFYLERLYIVGLSLQSKGHEDLALKLTKFALDKKSRTDKNLNKLLAEVQKTVSPKLLQRYENSFKY